MKVEVVEVGIGYCHVDIVEVGNLLDIELGHHLQDAWSPWLQAHLKEF